MQHTVFKENHISRLPALLLLQKLGYIYLTPEETLKLRGGKTTNILLENILRNQLNAINSIRINHKKAKKFSEQNIEHGISAIRNIPLKEGFMNGNKYVYNLLTSGKTLEQSINDDRKSYILKYIDWEHPERNIFHVTDEFIVNRTGYTDIYRADIVLFVNGIPLCIIECACPDGEKSLEQAIEQHLRYQKDNGMQSLYLYSTLLLSITPSAASYATTGTPKNLWIKWAEQYTSQKEKNNQHKNLYKTVNKPLNEEQIQKLFEGRYHYAKHFFKNSDRSPMEPTEQDRYLYNLCRPERLLDLIFNFTIYYDGTKKIARYYQYFAIKKTIEQISVLQNGKRKGGVIWHTQGSGKSLTMVMLAQAITLSQTISDPKIILVSDRMDFDQQITDTFKKCGIYAENAKTGTMLIELLESKTDVIITTVINKFETAIRKLKNPLTSPNIFILIDEVQRSQYGELGFNMRKTLPNACYIGMTGMPPSNKERMTARFGEVIKPTYSIRQAIEDQMIVPLLYERRKLVNYSSDKQRIYDIARDLSYHFRDNWQGTGFKGQLVCSGKPAAVQYKQCLDEIGIITSEVLIAPPDNWEGNETATEESDNSVKAFWRQIIEEYGTAKKYETNIINRFCNGESPEIIIVVDKLLTGFSEPKNTVMYLDRKLTNHTLLQAAARVNRVHEGKNFGYIIDYYGVLQELREAFDSFFNYEQERIQETGQMFANIDINYKEPKTIVQKPVDSYVKREIAINYDQAADTNLSESVLSHTDNETPLALTNNNAGKAFFDSSLEVYKTLLPDNKLDDAKEAALETALTFDAIIKKFIIENEKTIIEWQTKINILGKIKIAMEDYLIDTIKQKRNINLTFDQIDSIIEQCTEIAKLWFK